MHSIKSTINVSRSGRDFIARAQNYWVISPILLATYLSTAEYDTTRLAEPISVCCAQLTVLELYRVYITVRNPILRGPYPGEM